MVEDYIDMREILERGKLSYSGLSRRRKANLFPAPVARKGVKFFWSRAQVEPLLSRLHLPEPIDANASGHPLAVA
jgi:hypothetical protein